MKLTPEDKLILSCIKIHPSSTELDQINNLIPLVQGWEYLITTVIDRGELVRCSIKEYDISSWIVIV